MRFFRCVVVLTLAGYMAVCVSKTVEDKLGKEEGGRAGGILYRGRERARGQSTRGEGIMPKAPVNTALLL